MLSCFKVTPQPAAPTAPLEGSLLVSHSYGARKNIYHILHIEIYSLMPDCFDITTYLDI